MTTLSSDFSRKNRKKTVRKAVKKAAKNKGLERSLKSSVPEDELQKLKKELASSIVNSEDSTHKLTKEEILELLDEE